MPENLAALANLTDAELVALCRERLPGDTRPFEVLVNRYAGRVQSTCYRVIGNWGEAEELSQEVFVRVWRGLPAFEERSTFSTWLYQIALNVSRSALDKNNRRPSLSELPVDDFEQHFISPTTPEHSLLLAADRDLLLLALAQLSEDERQVLNLRESQDFSYQEVADHLSISLSAAKMRVVRARLALKKAYVAIVEGDHSDDTSD